MTLLRILHLRDLRYSEYRLSNRYAFVVAGLAILGVGVEAGALDLNLHAGGLLFPLVTIMAAALTCGVHRRVNEEGQQHQPGRHTSIRLYGPSRYVVVAGMAGLVVLLGTNLVRTYPAEVLLRRGQRALDQMKWDQAERALLLAWRLDHRNYAIAAAMGDLYTAQATWNRHDRDGLSVKAFEWYNRTLTLNEYAMDVRVKMGRLADGLGGRSNEALADYQRAIDADPHNASYHVFLGQHYLRVGDPAEAHHQLQLARELGAVEVLSAGETAN